MNLKLLMESAGGGDLGEDWDDTRLEQETQMVMVDSMYGVSQALKTSDYVSAFCT